MQSNQNHKKFNNKFQKIGVIGPGIVGMPMAALLAKSFVDLNENGEVIVIQRDSKFSGWKVDAINSGNSTIGGIEPLLNEIVSEAVSQGVLKASHDYSELKDADVVLVCVQTDKKGFEPDYEPLFDALNNLALALKEKPLEKTPLIIIESTLAPSSMNSLIKPFFLRYTLEDGKDIFLCNSPNRVMPGRLVERVISSNKIVGGLNPYTLNFITELYSRIVKGNLLQTNSLTAEVVKTLENAYRDVRIAFSTEIVRYCDNHNIDFYSLRDKVNKLLAQPDYASKNSNVVPTGGILIPQIGVGGHCLPKDGILLWWRKLEHNKKDASLSIIMNARKINDASPSETLKLIETKFGNLNRKNIALLGAAYRFNSEDTRNSPTLNLAQILLDKKCTVSIHDPFVKPNDQNILKFNLQDNFTNNLKDAIHEVELIIFCTSHKFYHDNIELILNSAPEVDYLFDGCNLYSKENFIDSKYAYQGIGRGNIEPAQNFIEFVFNCFRVVEKGVANELNYLINFLNENFTEDEFNKIRFTEVQKLADSCSTGCSIVNTGPIRYIEPYNNFIPSLVSCAEQAYKDMNFN